MEVFLKLSPKGYRLLRAHLLGQPDERAAFICVKPVVGRGRLELNPLEMHLIPPEDCIAKSLYGIELSDEARNRVFASAWRFDAKLIEVHSHPFSQRNTAFSSVDTDGFREFVPHVWWRLKGGPYVALVFGQRDFDGLAWVDSPQTVQPFAGIALDNKRVFKPTGRTIHRIEHWEYKGNG